MESNCEIARLTCANGSPERGNMRCPNELRTGATFIPLLAIAVDSEEDHQRFCEALAVITRGLVRVYMHASDGRQVTVRYVRPGGLLGVPALVGGPAPVFVQAVTAVSAFFFDVARVKRAARDDSAIAWAFGEEAVHRLYDVLEELAGNAFATVRQRVARHLLDLAAARPAAAGRVTALVSQQDLANSVGSVREVLARLLAELRAEGLVLTSPGRVEILDPVRLSRQLWSRTRDESHRQD